MLRLQKAAKVHLVVPTSRSGVVHAVRLSSSQSEPPSHLSSTPPPTSTPTPRPATFTTPDVPLAAPTPLDLSKPLPPTDLPVEDYASPLMHTASFFGTLFRWSVFGSVTVVVAGVAGLAATHLWVEKVELAGGLLDEAEDEGWSEEVEGWSGAHRGGGTDPRLGVLARSAIRGAWIASHWGSGGVASPVAPVNSSPFAVSGGARIGSPSPAGAAQVADAGFRLAEQYLLYALDRAARKGILVGGADAESGPASVGVDPAALELEQRLASLRERIGGLTSLAEAREGWERIYYALAADGERTGRAERERIRAARKLGEVSARMAGLSKGEGEKAQLEEAAKGWYLGGLMPVLSAGKGEGVVEVDKVEGVKHVTAGSSFWSFWTRQHPKTTPLAQTKVATALPTVVADLVLTLQQQSSPTTAYSPATQRTLLRSLGALETHLALTRQLDQAHAVQHAALAFAESLRPTDPSAPTTPPPTTLTPTTPTPTIAHSLTSLFLLTRTSLLRTHLAEVSLALAPARADPARADPAPSLALLSASLASCDAALAALDKSALLGSPQALFGGTAASRQRLFGAGARAVQRDARRTGAIAAGLLGFVHGQRKGWGEGDGEVGRVFWERSYELAVEAGDEGLEAQARRGREGLVGRV